MIVSGIGRCSLTNWEVLEGVGGVDRGGEFLRISWPFLHLSLGGQGQTTAIDRKTGNFGTHSPCAPAEARR